MLSNLTVAGVTATGLLESSSANCRSHKQAFTVIELLVVTATISMLVAILLPAVNAAREAGRRAACLNNLHQEAIAVHNYESAHDRLPFGQRALLTFAEYNKQIFMCPSVPTERGAWTVADYGFPTVLHVRPTVEGGSRVTKGAWSARSWRQVPDGLSKTWLFFEAAGDTVVYQGRPATHERGPWPSNVPTDIEAFTRSSVQRWIEHHEKGVGHPHYSGLELNRTNISGIYSFHPGGANTGTCDGGARFIDEGADPEILEALFSRNDGQITRVPRSQTAVLRTR